MFLPVGESVPKPSSGKRVTAAGLAVALLLTGAKGCEGRDSAPAGIDRCVNMTHPQPSLPGELAARVCFETDPPRFPLHLIGVVTARQGSLIQTFDSTKSGEAPVQLTVSYPPGSGTSLKVKGFLGEVPPPDGQSIRVRCEVYDGAGVLNLSASNQEFISPARADTEFVECTFQDRFVAPRK